MAARSPSSVSWVSSPVSTGDSLSVPSRVMHRRQRCSSGSRKPLHPSRMRNLLLRSGNYEQRTERVSSILLHTTSLDEPISSQISIGLVVPLRILAIMFNPSVSFSGHDVRLSRLPGWEKNSWGYHGDDGFSFSAEKMGSPYGPTYTSTSPFSTIVLPS